jgi:hypothetical protein
MDLIPSEVSRRTSSPLEIERLYAPDRDAMLAALRVVLDLPRVPITLKDGYEKTGVKSLNDSPQGERPSLAIYTE